MRDRWHFSDPWSCQGYGLARLLQSEDRRADVVAVVDGKHVPGYHNRWYSDVVKSADGAPIVPLAAASTRAQLEVGPIRLGRAVMEQLMLRAYEKHSFLRRAADAGVPVPRKYGLDEIGEGDFPLFFKEGEELGGGRRGIARSRNDLPVNGLDQLLIQEYVESQGTYGVAFLAKGGSILHTVTHWESASFPSTGGSAVAIELFHSQRLQELTAILADVFEFSGWGLAEFKYDAAREDFVLMEVNAKFWASLEFSFRNAPEFFADLFGVTPSLGPVRRLIYGHRWLGSIVSGELSRPSKDDDTESVLYPNLHRYVGSGLKYRLKRIGWK